MFTFFIDKQKHVRQLKKFVTMHHPVLGRQVVGQGLRRLASQSSSATFSSFRVGPVTSDKVWTPSPVRNDNLLVVLLSRQGGFRAKSAPIPGHVTY